MDSLIGIQECLWLRVRIPPLLPKSHIARFTLPVPARNRLGREVPRGPESRLWAGTFRGPCSLLNVARFFYSVKILANTGPCKRN